MSACLGLIKLLTGSVAQPLKQQAPTATGADMALTLMFAAARTQAGPGRPDRKTPAELPRRKGGDCHREAHRVQVVQPRIERNRRRANAGFRVGLLKVVEEDEEALRCLVPLPRQADRYPITTLFPRAELLGDRVGKALLQVVLVHGQLAPVKLVAPAVQRLCVAADEMVVSIGRGVHGDLYVISSYRKERNSFEEHPACNGISNERHPEPSLNCCAQEIG